jgi:hypothetical protein
VATAENEAQTWRYTTARPAPAWFQPDFDDSSWPQGPAGFGTEGTPGAHVRTLWNTADLWLRRTVTLPDSLPPSPMLRVHHDEDVEIYVNGILAATATSYTTDYEALPLTPAAKAALKPGQNLLAAHCHQTGGGQYLDLGLQW